MYVVLFFSLVSVEFDNSSWCICVLFDHILQDRFIGTDNGNHATASVEYRSYTKYAIINSLSLGSYLGNLMWFQYPNFSHRSHIKCLYRANIRNTSSLKNPRMTEIGHSYRARTYFQEYYMSRVWTVVELLVFVELNISLSMGRSYVETGYSDDMHILH